MHTRGSVSRAGLGLLEVLIVLSLVLIAGLCVDGVYNYFREYFGPDEQIPVTVVTRISVPEHYRYWGKRGVVVPVIYYLVLRRDSPMHTRVSYYQPVAGAYDYLGDAIPVSYDFWSKRNQGDRLMCLCTVGGHSGTHYAKKIWIP